MVGQDAKETRATLKGLEGIFVRVERFDDQLRAAGYDHNVFWTDVELKLRLAGIKVLTEEEMFIASAKPALVLEVSVYRPKPSTHMAPFMTNLVVMQLVTLATGEMAVATTWSNGSVGQGDVSFVRGSVKDTTDGFINAWLSVNPKP